MKNIYFIASTVYHLMVSYYYASKICSCNVRKILIWTDNYKDLDFNALPNVFEEIHVMESENKQTKFRKYWIRLRVSGYLADSYHKKHAFHDLHSDDVLIYFSELDFSTCKLLQLFKKKSDNIILCDEGSGTYSESKRKITRNEKLSKYIFGSVAYSEIGTSEFVKIFIVKQPALLPKSKVRKGSVIRQNTIFNDKKWLQSLNALSNGAALELQKYHGNKILWLGQPINEVGVDINTEVEILNKILSCFYAKYSVIVKKHPRDLTEKYDQIDSENICKYFVNHDTWIPVEVLVGQIEPDIIITPFSSAALNLYELGYGKRVIFCYKLFGLSIDDSWLIPHLENPDIRNVSTLEELRQIIDEFEKNPVRNNTEDLTVNDNADIDYLNSLLKDD